VGIEPTTFDLFVCTPAKGGVVACGVAPFFFTRINEMNNVRAVTGVRRVRNGRLAINRLSRAAKPRWRMILLDGQWYDRDRLRALVSNTRRRTAVPHSARALTAAELADVMDLEPWTLLPPRRPRTAAS
jgi:hypothetical protein